MMMMTMDDHDDNDDHDDHDADDDYDDDDSKVWQKTQQIAKYPQFVGGGGGLNVGGGCKMCCLA